MREIEKIFPIYKVENNAILSVQGDITVAFEVTLPEIFTLGERDYESFHQAWVRAIKVLPPHSIFHKQDLYVDRQYRADFDKAGEAFLSLSSERFFNERPYRGHSCHIFLTKRATGRKPSNSAVSNVLRKSIVPQQTIAEKPFMDFMDSVGQFERILADSGFMSLKRLDDEALAGTANRAGIIERYVFLLDEGEQPTIHDIHLNGKLAVGDKRCQLFTLSDAEELPSLCGPRINYDRYSTDRTKFSIGFASPLGMLLDCNHILNQYIFIEDAQKTLKKMEAKRLRLQSLSAYSRENAIARDATNDFLNEAISDQRLPVKAHFNVLAWGDDATDQNDLRNKVSSAVAQMDAVAKQETDGAPQVWFAGIPGNGADFPMNDTFDTFLEQATCFLVKETAYRSSISPFGIRLGDRLHGKVIHLDPSDEPIKMGWSTNRNKFILGPSGGYRAIFN